MDYCKRYGLSSNLDWMWEYAEDAYNEHEKVLMALDRVGDEHSQNHIKNDQGR